VNVARVIPCLDVDAGRVVKGVNFVGLRDAGDPVELAARYDLEGADEVVFLDITASSDARDTMIDIVERTAEQVFIPFTVGGGIRSVADARRILRAGADKVSLNTAAVDRPELIGEVAAEFGAQCVVVAIDAKTFAEAMERAEAKAVGLRGSAVTPFLLARLAEETDGVSLLANRALIVANARLAALVAAGNEWRR